MITLEMIRERLIESIMPALDTFAYLCKILDADPAYILCINQ